MAAPKPLRLTNPHSVLAALEHRPGAVREVQLPPRGANEAWQQVAERAQAQGVPVELLPGAADGRGGARRGGGRDHGAPGAVALSEPKDGRSGSACAMVRPAPEARLGDLFADGASRDEGHGLWLALDQVQDPRNLGAVMRSAAFFGAQGVVLTRDQSAPLSAVAYDTASGGMECVPHATVTNLRRALDNARDAGLWILGAAGEAERDVAQVPRDRPWLLVLGNEERGLRRLTREGCDDLCRLTPRGGVDALNVSAAAAALLARLTV